MKRRMLQSKAPLFEKGRVRETSTDQVGIIVRLGPQVSEVRWDNGDVRFVSNSYLCAEDAVGA